MLPSLLRTERVRSALLAALATLTPSCTYDYLGAFAGSGGSTSSGSSITTGTGGSAPVSDCPGAEPGDAAPWLHVLGSKEEAERTHAIVVDGDGNVYAGGAIAGDHADGLFAGSSGDTTSDAFVVGLSADGKERWRHRFAALGSNDGVLDMAVRGGVVLVSGTSKGGIVVSADDGPLVGAWLATLDAATGAPIWTRQLGEAEQNYPQAVTFAPTGDIVVGGRFQGTLAFGAAAQLSATSAPGDLDAYVAVLDATGDPRSVKWIQSAATDRISDVTTDSDGYIYASGTLGASGVTICSPHPAAEGGDALAVKLDPSAGCDGGWSNAIGGPLLQMGLSIAVADSNHVYLGGNFTGVLRQGAAEYGETAPGTVDGFVMSLAPHDGNGSMAFAFGAAGASAPDSVSCLAPTDGGVLATGYFGKGASLYETSGGHALDGSGGTDILVAKIDGLTPLALATFGDAADQWEPDPALNQMRIVSVPRGMILAGTLRGDVTLGGMDAKSHGGSDAFVARLCAAAPLE